MSSTTLGPLASLADGWKTLEQAKESLSRGSRAVLLEGTPIAAKGWLLAKLARDLDRPLIVLTYNEEQMDRIASDLALYLPEDRPVRLLPSSLPLLLDDEESERDVSRAGRRIATLISLAQGEPLGALVAVAPALLQKTPRLETLKNRRLTIKAGETLNPDAAAARLNAFGYRRTDQVMIPGSFARRGDILDVFPADSDRPVRVDLFGDDVESVRYFDPDSQRSEEKIDIVHIAAAHEPFFTRESMARAANELKQRAVARQAEMQLAKETPERIERLRDSGEADIVRLGQAAYFPGVERYLPLLHPDAVTALDYLPDDCLIVFDEPAQMHSHADRDMEQIVTNLRGRAERGEILPVTDDLWIPFEAGMKQARANRPTLLLELLARTLPWTRADEQLMTGATPAETFAGQPGPMAEALITYSRNKVRIVVVSLQAPRVRGVLQDRQIPEVPLETLLKGGSGVALVNGSLKSGFKIPDARLLVLTDNEIIGSAADKWKKMKRREFREGMRITSLLDVKEGDYVVHINHGIGVYRGLTKMTVQGIQKEYLQVEYEGNDKLYVPVDQVDRVQKYIGSEAGRPQVNKLGGNEWARTTAKAQRQVKEIAKDLIELYAARQSTPGHAYSEDTPWQREMEDAFPYIETPDQDAAIRDVKRDLEAPRPMDRLICGDVGFGKTEVAMRAAFKVASEGRQVAVLCPTTVLCAQHYQTFTERMAAFPLKVDQLSRFRSTREQNKTLSDLRDGAVDIVIATHRLLSKDVQFKDLGLVIVDEEQRFGVTHKERLKQLRKTVDVLSMSATPIPRTLQMSLSGIRDLSLINDPPEGRTPVKTLIKEYDDQLIREAILREIDRGGQIFFVHNRVDSIYHVADHLRRIVPTATFRIGHGQMHEDELEETMVDFYLKKFDVLVSTTIVESGLDIPNANTIIIDNADKFGLGQLYQLRGRVGRAKTQAYAILLYKKNKSLSTIAEQRLGAVREFSDLGSGYKIALRDLELRGSGNILGAEQSGMVMAVGLDLYMQLLESTIREMKGEEPEKEDIPLPTVDLPITATIPEEYIPSEPQRILMYKKLAAVRDREGVSLLQEEFEDRFGDPPTPLWNALSLIRLRLRCQEIGIESIGAELPRVNIQFKRSVKLPAHAIKPLTFAFKQQRHNFTPERVTLNLTNPARLLQTIEEMLEILDKAMKEPAPPTPERGSSVTGRHGKNAPPRPPLSERR